jgi:hypothetical protein
MEKSQLPTPEIQVNDHLHQVTTFGTLVPLPPGPDNNDPNNFKLRTDYGNLQPELDKIDPNNLKLGTNSRILHLEPEDRDPNDLKLGLDYCNLRELLKACQITHTDGFHKFWPDQLLRRALTRERVFEELESFRADQNTERLLWGQHIQWYLQKLFPRESSNHNTENGAENAIEASDRARNPTLRSYIKIYALLVLCEKQPSLKEFIDADIHDDDLPFIQCKQGRLGSFRLALSRHQATEISCLRSWKCTEVEQFYGFQFNVLIPYFCSSTDPKAPVKDVKYTKGAIMPWIKDDLSRQERGGYGIVSCIRIHSACHGFRSLAQVKMGNGMFALKRLISQDIKEFQNEKRMLGIFSGHHDHLIMLLQSFSWNGNNFLLFPWADCDLDRYWGKTKAPYDKVNGMNPRLMKWVSRQILGLTAGLHNIHNPAQLDSRSNMMFGRHGDLKPENILCIQPEGEQSDQDGILVIGDLGISATHREASRSNQPGKKIPHSPNYRPPECDLEGGIISRAFDVWTLGCLFLEMVCWILGGIDLVNEFSTARAKVFYLGSATNTNIFFDIQEMQGGGHVILVKQVVNSVSCSSFIYPDVESNWK